jgi:hypothetical protein
MISPTISMHYFRTGVRTYKHGAGYDNDDNSKVGQSADPIVC